MYSQVPCTHEMKLPLTNFAVVRRPSGLSVEICINMCRARRNVE